MKHRLLRAAMSASLVIAYTPGQHAQAQKPSLPGYPAPGAEPIVTVLEAGSAPRTPLRYRLRPAQQETMDMTLLMGMAMDLGGTPVSVDVPPFTISARVSVTDQASNGDYTYAIAFTKFDVGAGANEAAMAAFKRAAAGITAVKGTGVFSNRGVPRSVKIDSSGVSDPTMKQALDQAAVSFQNMSMPMPEEPVGLGARWEVRTAIDSGGASIFQRTEYEVISMDGLALAMKVKLEQTAPPQPFSVPNLPPGTDATITKMTGTGSGTVSARLDALTPTSSLESTSGMFIDMAMGGQTQSMTVQVKMKVTVAPGK